VIWHPAFVLIFGALLVPLLGGKLRSLYVIALPMVALIAVALLPKGDHMTVSWLAGFGDLTLLRVDGYSKPFGYIFTINAIAAFVFAFHVKDSNQQVSSLFYIGSALGAVFAGDLITLYVFWEVMAVASTMLILARRSSRSMGAGFRYVLVHILGGLLFLAGIVITYNHSGTIAFDGFNPETDKHLGTWLILIGFLVNAAAPPFSAWLSDAYPEATVTGSVILSAYTTKTAVYALIRGYPGWDILITVGCFMALYGIVYALLENDMRRILAYSIINQVGFMVCAVGIGTAMCLDGAIAHAFCHIIYKSLLWMSAGAVLYRVGKSKCTDLGGLYKSMPLSLWLGCIGALAISAVPLTSGFTSKTIILAGAAYEHHFWPWFILEIASAGVFLHAGIKFPYFVFFAKDQGHKVEEAPRHMIWAMGILAFFCIALGLFPKPLYALLPNHGSYDFSAWKPEKVITQLQLLLLSALTFFVWIKWLKRTDTIVLDTDWFYRKGGPLLQRVVGKVLNGLNAVTYQGVIGRLVPRISSFAQSAPSRIFAAALVPIWVAQGIRGEALTAKREDFFNQSRLGAFAVGITACLGVLVLALLFFF